MSNLKEKIGCGLIIIIIFLLYGAYDTYVLMPRKIVQERLDLENIWSPETVSFFEEFNCSGLTYNSKRHKIKKFIVVTNSSVDSLCKLSEYGEYTFNSADEIKMHYSKNINEINTIVWIKNIWGSIPNYVYEDEICDFEYTEINFIDKNALQLYKKISIPQVRNLYDVTKYRGSRKVSTSVQSGCDDDHEMIIKLISKEIQNN
jgi:hypothetical protein